MAAIVLVSLCAVGASTLSVSAAQSSSSNVQTPSVVGAPVGSGAPGVCSNNSTNLYLFLRGGSDNALYLKISPDGTTWPSLSTPLGGVLTSAPAATSPGDGNVSVFVRGSDGSVWFRNTTDGATWSPWNWLGGQLPASKAPAACSWVSGGKVETMVFVTGTNNHCFYRTLVNNKPTSSWIDLGGILTSAPAATALPDGSQIGLFVAGGNYGIYYKHYTAGAWAKSWSAVGGQLLAGTSPAAYNLGPSQIGWFVTGTDSQLYHSWVGSGAGYEALGGVLTSSPACTARMTVTPTVIDVFARGSTGQFAALYQITFNSGGSGHWGIWTAIGGV